MSDRIAAELEGLRPGMLRFAALQLRDDAAAEDAVQEALLAAFESAGSFGKRAQVRTWVFSILRHKIVDIIRRRCKEPLLDLPENEIPGDAFDALFDERGHWRRDERPADWGDPERTLENAQFWKVFDACLTHLPENTARVFMMREFLGFETGEICKELRLTPTNCWVVLHRARMRLRQCLQGNWFDKEASC